MIDEFPLRLIPVLDGGVHYEAQIKEGIESDLSGEGTLPEFSWKTQESARARRHV